MRSWFAGAMLLLSMQSTASQCGSQKNRLVERNAKKEASSGLTHILVMYFFLSFVRAQFNLTKVEPMIPHSRPLSIH